MRHDRVGPRLHLLRQSVGTDSERQTLFDGVPFDPAEPEKYVKAFAVNTMA